MTKKYIPILLILFSITNCNKAIIKKSNRTHSKDSIIFKNQVWNNKELKVFADLYISDNYDQKLYLHSSKGDTLLILKDGEGADINIPFSIKNTEKHHFINFFKTWDGTGYYSERMFYHLDTVNYKLTKVKGNSFLKLLKNVKNKYKIKDSLYTRNGMSYNNFAFDKSCFDKDGKLAFGITLYNHNKPELNDGLRGYKVLTGVYEFINKENGFYLEAKELKLIDP
ncbi:hypothetical protein [uncultured Algibacter sp.]|uniref:hypothetical protein n=1 Tax=uncultured Algibacter sp. TaxID=298659 RepID=UPI003216A386